MFLICLHHIPGTCTPAHPVDIKLYSMKHISKCKSEEHKQSFHSENYEQTFPNKNHKKSHRGGRGVTVLWEVHQLESVCPYPH